MGYIVWGEYGNWGMDYSNIAVLPRMMSEWIEIVNRDFNHPSIVGWCPLCDEVAHGITRKRA